MSNVVAIVGRPNVGKSTLFNRLVESRAAIMDNTSGVTRDRHYGHAEWNGKFFSVIDTGGYVHGSDDIFEQAIRSQVEMAVDEATVILFMVDCTDGLTGLDKDFANYLRGSNKPVLIGANKADNRERSLMTGEFYSLGLGAEVFPISSISGGGTGDLLDEVVKLFPSEGEKDPYEGIPKIAIVGRPNVGKSSFLNLLLGEERSIVTDIAGTTRDAINSLYNAYGKEFVLIDTAGIRKKAKVKEDIEFYSVMRSLRALENSDVSIVMIDAKQGFESQDMNIVALAHRNRKGIMIMVNKWDLVEKDTQTAKAYEKGIREKLGEMAYVPVIFTSVLTKQRVFKAVDLALNIYERKTSKISTSKLNDALLKDIERTPPPAVRGKYIKIKYVTQLPTPSPTFAFFCNHPKDIKPAYERFLINRIRSRFGFEGVPVTVVFRKK